MGRFKPKEPENAAPVQKAWSESDYREMEGEIEKAREMMKEWKETMPKKYNELRSTEYFWLYMKGAVKVYPYYKSKDDPVNDLHYLAVVPGHFDAMVNKWSWYQREYERKHFAERKEEQHLDRLAAAELSSKMKLPHHGE